MSRVRITTGGRPLFVPALAALGVLALVSHAAAQLTPDRLYYGINRAIPMKIALPAGAQGDTEIQLLAPVTAEVVEKAAAAAGPVNLAEKFPMLWTTAAPRLLYAQLVVGGKKTGPAVVLQPMVSPPYATGADRTGNPMYGPERKVYSGVRAYVDKNVAMETSKGEIEFALRPDMAPNTVWNFRELVDGGFYTEVIFHRIADLSGDGVIDILQVGDPGASDPSKAGSGGPGYMIDLEPSKLPHDFGVISMARTSDPNTNGSQIFMCLNKTGTSFLDGKYTTFGQTIKGGETLKALAAVQTNQQARPIDPPMIKSARLVDAAPYGDGPRPQTDPSEGQPSR
jgi:peptidyl-prolyl cis-trans isomerase B (cyclophilin B)